ncbi:MAG: glycosyltransferase family 2 protein [Elusimicrobia bacterium]|nr:glycosyltransferase family 2 protein [Elusimicrobiota bacterium]
MLSIVIPVYNEEEDIAETLSALRENAPVPHEILVVYDSDEDSTLPVLRRLSAQDPTLRILKNSISPGPSGALRTGFSSAKGSKILVTMADRCDDLSQIPQFLSLVPAQADIACPSRYCPGGAQILPPSLKAWAPRTAGKLLRHLAGVPTYDPTNSFKLYSARVLRDFPLSSTVSFSVTLEIVAKSHCLGYRIVEIPTVWRDRRHGKTHFRLGPALVAYLPWFCLALLRNRLFQVPAAWLRYFLKASPVSETA